MDPIRAHKTSSLMRWRSSFLLILLVLSLGAIPKVLGADSAPGASERLQGDAWVEADPDMAYRYVTVGWTDWAAVHFSEIARHHGDIESWMMAGIALETLGDIRGALDAYGQGARLAPDERSASAALTLYGNLLFKHGDSNAAKEAFEAALELSSQNAQAMYGLGRVTEQDGGREEAIALYRRAAETAREWIEPVVAQAALLIDGYEYVEAITLLRSVDYLGTRHAEYHYQLGLGYEGLLLMLLDQGMSDEVIEALSTLGIDQERATSVLREQALHAAARVQQLESEHPGADRLLSRLNQI